MKNLSVDLNPTWAERDGLRADPLHDIGADQVLRSDQLGARQELGARHLPRTSHQALSMHSQARQTAS